MMSRVFFPALGFALLALAPPLAARQEPAPPPADGRYWLLAVPTVAGGAALAPHGFSALLADEARNNELQAFAAEAYFAPAAGRYRFWVEGEDAAGKAFMSPCARRLEVPAAAGQFRQPMPVVPAGRVGLPAGLAAGEELELRLYHVETADYAAPAAGGAQAEPRWELWRAAKASEVGSGLRMPRGKTVGLVFDRGKSRVVAFSRPFELAAGQTVALPAEPPGGGQQLLARFSRATVPAEDPEANVAVSLGGRSIEPGLLVASAGSLLAVFYGLPPGRAELLAEAGHDTLPFHSLGLAAGAAESLELELVRRPTLTVRLELPDAARGPDAELIVMSRNGKDELAKKPLGDARVLEFRDLPAQPVRLDLVTAVGTLHETADLSSGEDTATELRVEAAEVYGRVFLGDEPAAGRLSFLNTAGGKVEARSDENGDYRVLALAALRYVDIELAGREGQPFHQFFMTGPLAAGERDFHLPATRVEVTVRDAASGKAVPGAQLRIKNSFRTRDKNGEPMPPRTPGGEPPTTSQMQKAQTDADGKASVFYLSEGTVEVTAAAEGYLEPEQPAKAVLAENGQARIEIRLQPLGQQAALELLLPGGGKAAGATVLLLGRLEPMEVLATGKAGPDGVVKLPEALAGAQLVALHPESSFLFGRWQPKPAPEIASIQLPARANPLSLRAKSRGEIVPYAEVMLFVDGQRLAMHLLFQLTGSRPMTENDGVFSAAGLPQAPVKVIIFPRGDPAKAEAVRQGQYDDQAVEIPYPWPPLVEVEAIE